jgi:hypothetical protein
MARHGKAAEMGTISNAMLGLAVAGSLSVLSACESPQGQPVRKISNTDRQGSAEGLVIAGLLTLKKCREWSEAHQAPCRFQIQASSTSQ